MISFLLSHLGLKSLDAQVYWSGVFNIIGVVFVAIATVFTFTTTNELNIQKDESIAKFQNDAKIESAKAHEKIAEANKRTEEAKERQKELELEIEKLREKISPTIGTPLKYRETGN